MFGNIWHSPTQSDDDSSELIRISYIATTSVLVIILAAITAVTIYKFVQMSKEKAINVYRILQLSMLILYIVIIIITSFMKFKDGIPLYNYLIYIYVGFAYFYAETVNIICWINFKIQIDMYSSGDAIDYDYMKKIEFKEKILIAILIIIAIAYLTPGIVITIIGIGRGGGPCDPFNAMENGSENGTRVAEVYVIARTVLASALLFVVFFKILSGVMLLTGMRHNLNYYYKQKRKSIRITIILSCFVTLWKSAYNFFPQVRQIDLNYNYVSRRSFLEPGGIVLLIFIALLDVLAPIIVIAINIKTVNFIRYIQDLMNGGNQKNNCVSPSIFILKRKQNMYGCHESLSEFSLALDQVRDRKDSAITNHDIHLIEETSEDEFHDDPDFYKQEYKDLYKTNRANSGTLVLSQPAARQNSSGVSTDLISKDHK